MLREGTLTTARKCRTPQRQTTSSPSSTFYRDGFCAAPIICSSLECPQLQSTLTRLSQSSPHYNSFGSSIKYHIRIQPFLTIALTAFQPPLRTLSSISFPNEHCRTPRWSAHRTHIRGPKRCHHLPPSEDLYSLCHGFPPSVVIVRRRTRPSQRARMKVRLLPPDILELLLH